MYCVITSTVDTKDQPQQVNVRSDKTCVGFQHNNATLSFAGS